MSLLFKHIAKPMLYVGLTRNLLVLEGVIFFALLIEASLFWAFIATVVTFPISWGISFRNPHFDVVTQEYFRKKFSLKRRGFPKPNSRNVWLSIRGNYYDY